MAFGFAEGRILNQTIDSLTNFHLASVSKLFSATAIMQLLEQGKLSLDAKLFDYIRLEKPKDACYASVNNRQMLTHSSGIADTDDYDWNKPNYDSLALGNYCKQYIDTKKLRFEPGSRFDYSKVGFNMLGHIIERVTQQSF